MLLFPMLVFADGWNGVMDDFTIASFTTTMILLFGKLLCLVFLVEYLNRDASDDDHDTRIIPQCNNRILLFVHDDNVAVLLLESLVELSPMQHGRGNSGVALHCAYVVPV
jgi:hypothetical protein